MNPIIEWKPMSEAPKDGTRILIIDSDHNAWMAHWGDVGGGREGWQVGFIDAVNDYYYLEIEDPLAWSRIMVPLVYPCYCGGLFWVQGGDMISPDTRTFKFAICDKCEVLLMEEKTNTISETIRNYNRRQEGP